jgi:hypothetical protein
MLRQRFGVQRPLLYRDSKLDLTPEQIMNDLGIVAVGLETNEEQHRQLVSPFRI